LEFWPGGYRYYRDTDHFPLGTDSVLLAAFTAGKPGQRVLDLGTGGGYLGLMLLARQPKLDIDAVDIVPSAVKLADGNARLNGAEDRLHPMVGDLRRCEDFLERGRYDTVICNPPYFDAAAGAVSRKDNMAIARSEGCTVFEVCRAADYALKFGGDLFLCWKPARMAELFAALNQYRLEPKRLRFCQSVAGSAPYLLLVSARKGAKSGLIPEPPLVMRNPDGSFTDEILEIYHRGKEN